MNPFLDKFYEDTAAELQTVKDKDGLKTVCSKAQRKLDEVFAAELFRSTATIACCSGCYYCCHVKVDIQPRDAFLIVDFIRERFSPERQADVLRTAHENWDKIKPMTVDQHFMAVLPCPLLEQGKCSVYQVRPSSCRIAHSQRVEPCKQSVEHPDLPEESIELVPNLRFATAGAHLGISRAFEKSGYDSQPYDLNAALIEATENPSSEKRWRDGKKAFPQNMLAKDWAEQMKSVSKSKRP
jgi:Fe-S-cluster containining protein